MFAVFNSFQITLLFAVAPFAIQYTKTADFYGAATLFWVLLIGYLVGFFGMCVCVYSTALEHK